MSTVLPASETPSVSLTAPTQIHHAGVSMVESTALARLALSRERLRREMLQRSAPKRMAADGSAMHPSLQDRLKSVPLVGVLFEALASWWANHPLNAVSAVAAGAARTAIEPMAQRNPVALMVLSIVLGGALVATRPWRWLLKPALFAGLVPQLVSKLMAQVPLESWMSFASNLSKPHAAAPAAPAARDAQ